MRKISMLIAIAVTMMSFSLSFAADPKMSTNEKNECLLVSEKCQNLSVSLQEKIAKLQAEIKKGDKVYSPEELKNLQKKLSELNRLTDEILNQYK